jgi:hypothetical protein
MNQCGDPEVLLWSILYLIIVLLVLLLIAVYPTKK